MKILHLTLALTIAYIKSNWKLFLLGVVAAIGLVIFLPRLPSSQTIVIGLSGDYSLSSLPQDVQREISLGLTKLAPDGQVTPGAAKSWQVSDSGKTITFFLDTTLIWQDGKPFDSNSVNYNLKSVELSRPAPDQIRFNLKEPFAPLLTIASQPLFKSGLVGLGQYQVKSLNFTGRFVSTLSLADTKSDKKIVYRFYPNDDALLLALKLGNVQEARNLHLTSGLEKDKHYLISSRMAPATIATLFFNNDHPFLEDKSVRQGLTYLLPDEFSGGETADSPLARGSWLETPLIKKYPQNFDQAQKLLGKIATGEAKPKLTLFANRTLVDTAKTIAHLWTKAQIPTDVQVADIAPENYDVYLTYLEIPPDPDQYSLWHSTQATNLAHYKSLKVDKLLEEGRQTLNTKERKDIYANFLKAITEDVPAAFLFYPKLYTITRK